MSTYRELYLFAKRELAAAGIDDSFDAAALTEHFLGLDRTALALRGDRSPSAEEEARFLQAVKERADRRPLQYLLGRWEFMGLSLRVGEGVLIPREDTAVLVEALAERLRSLDAPVGLDLCAGTGAVALGLCSLLPKADMTCLELSDRAFSYLKQNLAAYPRYRIRAEQADILLPETAAGYPAGSLDLIASNPPYIKTEELAALQPEVRKEPSLALNGGPDGLLFYRAIAALWLPLLKPGGVLAVEIGEDQGQEVSALLGAHGLRDISVTRDLAGLDRCVSGVYQP